MDVTGDAEDVLGELHVILPALYFYFPKACAEIDRILTSELCKELLE